MTEEQTIQQLINERDELKRLKAETIIAANTISEDHSLQSRKIDSLTADLESLKKENQNLRLQLMTSEKEYHALGSKFDRETERWQERDMDELNKRKDLEYKLTALTTKAKEQEELLERFYYVLKIASNRQMGVISWEIGNDVLQAYETYKGKKNHDRNP